MKDNYSEMNVDMEQLLFSKNYEDLTAAELNEIKDFVSSKEEFNLMKSTLMNVKTSFGTEEEIEPVDAAKENLMKMFEQKHGKVIPMNTPRPFYRNPLFQIGVAAMFVLGIIYFYPKDETTDMTAMNESEEVSADEEKSEMKESEATVTEEATEAPAEESLAQVPEDKTVSDQSDEKPNFESLADSRTVTTATGTTSANKDVVGKNAASEFAKGNGSVKSDGKEADDLAKFDADVYRSSTKKEKEKLKSDEDKKEAEIAYDGNTSPAVSNATVATGGSLAEGIAVADEVVFASKRADDKKGEEDLEKSKSGKATHTNTAGGLFYQPGKPAADMKSGVSLKDEPALAEFLFTAL